MKTKLRRVSKRSLSMVLAILLMMSIIAVGTISASSYTSLANSYILFDNTDTGYSTVYCYIGHNSYAKSYTMSKVGSTNIWKLSFGNDTAWTDRTKMYFANHGDSPNGQNYGIDTQYGWNTTGSTRTALITAANNDGGSCFFPAGNNSSTLTRRPLRVVAGDIASNSWDNTADTMSYSSSTHSKTYNNVAAGDYTFAVVGFDDWNTSYRWAAKGTLTANGAGSWANANDDDQNIKLTLTSKATVKISLNSSNKVDVTLTPSSHTASVSSQPSNGSLYVGTSSSVGTSTSITVAEGATYYIKATPATGYKLATLKVGSTSVIGSNTGATSAVTVSRVMGTSNESVTATFTAQTHTVTLNANGGSGGSSSVTATYGSAMPSATMPTRDGYDFAGYYDTSATSGGNQYYTAAGASARTWNKTSNTTLYARWTAKSYSVSCTGSNVTYTTKPTSGTYGTTVSFVVTASSPYVLGETTATYVDKNGATQSVSLTGSNGSYSFTMPAGNVTIVTTAVRTPRTVTVTKGTGVDSYVVNGATYTASHDFTVSDGDSFTITSVSYSTGYENNGNTLSIASVTSNQTITLTGKKTSYTITKASATNGSFTVKKGTTAVTSANYGDTITITPTANTNYEVDTVKYNDGSDHTIAYSSGYSFSMPAHNVTVTVTFKEKKYTVSVVSESTTKGTVASSSVSAGNLTWVTLPVATAKTGYTFSTWEITSGSGTLNNATSATSGAIKASGACTVTARFVETMNAITIQPLYEGTEPLGTVTPVSGNAGVATSLSISATARTGYAFTKWTATSGITITSSTSSSTTIKATAGGTVTANFKVTRIYLDTSEDLGGNGKWSKDGATIKAVFGSSYLTMTKVTGEDDIWWVDVPSGFTVGTDNIKFQRCDSSGQTEWNITGAIKSSATKNMYKITGWTTVAVQDGAYVPETKYAVTINSGSGGTVTYNTTTEVAANSSETVQVGATARSLVATPQAGYHFTGWTRTGGAALASTTNASTTLTASAAGTVTAAFEQDVYTVSLSGSNCTLKTYSNSGMTTEKTSFNYNNTVYYKLTPASGYRITSIKVGNGSAVTQTGTGNKTGSFTITGNTTITVTTVQYYSVTLTRKLDSTTSTTPFATTQYRIGTSGSYTTYNGALNVDSGSVVYFKVSYNAGYEYSSVSGATVDTANTIFKTSAISGATTVTLTATKTNYTVNSTISSGSATGNAVKFRIGSSGSYATSLSTAHVGDTVSIQVTTASGYYLTSFTASAGTAPSIPSGGGNGSTYTMSYTMTASNVTFTAAFAQEATVNFNIDMHGSVVNSSNALEVSITPNSSSTTAVTDHTGASCKITFAGGTLTKQGTSTVYSGNVTVPLTANTIYFVVKYKTTNYKKSLTKAQISGGTVWLETASDSPQDLSIVYLTNSTPTVANGYQRIYLKKPFDWKDTTEGQKWTNIGVYYWGDNPEDIGWTNSIKMHYLGTDTNASGGYYYYYVDIPTAISQGGTNYTVKNLIFQGWGDNDSLGGDANKILAQTENVMNFTKNYFTLDDSNNVFTAVPAASSASIPSYTRYASSVTVQKGETQTINIKPTTSCTNITYSTSNSSIATVSSTGVVTPKARGTATITVKIYGTVGYLVRSHEDSTHKDYKTYTVTVTVKDPSVTSGFNIMSLATRTSTITIPAVSGTQPGYFDAAPIVAVTGTPSAPSAGYTSSAIITATATQSVSGVGTKAKTYTVKYAAPNSTFTGYSGITVTANEVTSKSIHYDGSARYGFKEWQKGSTAQSYNVTKSVTDGVETAVTKNFELDGSTFSEIFEQYTYVDVTFNFDYYEYETERTVQKLDEEGNPIPKKDGSGNIIEGQYETEQKQFYYYDPEWVGNETRTNSAFDASKHRLRTYTVANFEVRNKTASAISASGYDKSQLIGDAAEAIADMPTNNYYNYTLNASTIKTIAKNSDYKATIKVELTHTPKTYKVYRNGTKQSGGSGASGNYYYQEYANLTNSSSLNWILTDSTNTYTGPTMYTGKTYKFRVTGDTYLKTTAGTISDAEFNRSRVNLAGQGVSHEARSATDATIVEKLTNNFYIADFFDPAKVLNDRGLQEDDVTFVGGGVLYYQVKDGTPAQKPCDAGYVDPGTGLVDEAAVKEFLQEKIEAPVFDLSDSNKVVPNTIEGTDDRMAIAYGTEIKAKKDEETDIRYRYLPYEVYNRTSGGDLEIDPDTGNFSLATNRQSNTYRYSNALKAYQYIYASKQENKAANEGKDMRLYAFYIYSYTDYDKVTGVPQTVYKVVLSDQPANASTYFNN